MSAAEVTARKTNFAVGLIAAACIGIVLARAPVQDAAADDAARAHIEQQCKGAGK